MATEGPLYGSSATSLGDGAAAWNSLGNLYADDGAGSSVILSTGQTSDTVRIDGFGFAIPTGDTINGITVTMERYVGVGGNSDRLDNLQLTKTGLGDGNDYADTLVDWSTPTPEVKSFGGVADLWGQSWTPAEINASTFGVRLRARCVTSGGSDTCVLDYVTITITYTPADGSSPQTVSSSVPLWSRAAPFLRSQRRILEYIPDYVPETADTDPEFVRHLPRRSLPTIAAISRVFGAADDFPSDTTVEWQSAVIWSRPLLTRPETRRSRVVLLDAPDGQGSVCCCPFGAVVVSRRFATALVVADDSTPSASADPFIPVLRPVAPNTAAVVADKFATAILIANTCTC